MNILTVQELTPRGVEACRSCQSPGLVSVLDLGEQPLANGLVHDLQASTEAYPLHLRSCPTCGLGQVGEYASPDTIFAEDYPYLSSVSTSWVAHARAYAAVMTQDLELTAGDLVVEVASNDGYLLREFMALGVQVLGVEPARNVAARASAEGIPTVVDFFGRGIAERVVAEQGHPRLVAVNNVLAHVPDMDDFVGGLSLLCDDVTVITVENPSYLRLLQEAQLDTIYHEHYSYLSAHAIARLAQEHGLELIRVQELPTHGGSYRYWLARAGSRPVEKSVATVIAQELEAGLLSPALWARFREESQRTLSGLVEWLTERRKAGRRVAAYGAAAKGNTLLNAIGATDSDFVAVADGSVEKQGKWLPGSRIPIVEPTALTALRPSDVLILPWNLAAEIAPLVEQLVPGAECWLPIPWMRRVDIAR